MALDEKGNAVPIKAHTPIGRVQIEGFTLEQLCRALAVHAMLITGKQGVDTAEANAQAILAFALSGEEKP